MRRTLRQRLPEIGVLLLFLLLPLLMFWQQTIGGKTLIPAENLYQYQPYAAYREQVGAPAVPHNALVSDLVLQNFQFKSFIRESFAQGEIPLWNPYQFSGIPFFAAGQQSTLYPFSIIYYVLPLASAYGWFMVSQMWLAGIFAYLFVRGLGVGRLGGVVAGVTYQLSGFLVISAVFPMIVAAVVWLPLILLMIEFTLRQRPALKDRPASMPWIAIGAVALGCCVLAGHVEITYYTLLVSAYYTAARLLYILRRSRSTAPSDSASKRSLPSTGEQVRTYSALRFVLRRGLAVVLLVALGMGLGAVQFLPTVLAAQNNFRDGSASFGQVLDWAHPARDVIQFLLPNFYGNPSHHSYFDVFTGQTVSLIDMPTLNTEGNPLTTINWSAERNYVEAALYVGVLPLALALYGLLRRRTVHQVLLALLGVVSLSFMFGLPTYIIVYILPGISQLHSPFRWVFPFTLCIAVLAGFGMDTLLSSEKSRWTRRFGFVLAGIGALTLVGLLISRLFYAQVAPLIERIFNALALAPQAYASAEMFYSYQFVNLLIFAIITLLSGLIFLLFLPLSTQWRGVGKRSLHGVRLGVLALIAADLILASYSFNPASDPALLDFTPPAITWLQEQPGDWRYTTYEDPTHSPSQPFNANMTMRYGLRDVRGYESIIPKPYVELMQSIAPQVQLEYNRIAPIYTTYSDGFNPHDALESYMLDTLSVRYVITDPTLTITAAGYTLAYEDESARIWENAGAVPRVQIYRLRTIEPNATITRDTGREKFIDLSYTGTESAALIVSESYAPGWRAYIRPRGGEESEEIPLEMADNGSNLQQIDLPGAGDWTVRLVYSPATFQVGLFASFISGVLVLLGSGVWFWRLFVAADPNATSTMRVARNSVAPILLNLFNRGIDMAFAFVMLRILGPTDAGWYFYAGIIFVWFDIFTNFGLNLYLTREVARDRSRAWHVFFNTSAMRVGLAVLGVPLLLGVLGIRQATISPPINDAALIAIFLLYLGLLPNSLSTGLTALYYAFERAEVPAAVATAATLSKAVFGLLALLGGFGIIGLAAVSIITNILTLALLAWNGRDMLREGRAASAQRRLDRPLIRRMSGESWFLMLNHFLATIFFQIDVIILEAMQGARVVGQYSVAYKWIAALNVIPAFFTQALLPVMSRQAHEDRAGLRRNYILAIKLLVAVALPVAVVFTFMAEFLAGLLGGAQYLPDAGIATQLMIWSIPIGWINSLTQYVLIALDLQRRVTRAFVVAVVFNIATNLVFIPQYGYRAAAITTIASEAVLLIPFARLLSASFGSLPWVSMIWRQAFAAAVMFAVLALGWNVQPLLALVVSGAVYIGLLLALKPLDADEMARLLPLLPSRLRRAFA